MTSVMEMARRPSSDGIRFKVPSYAMGYEKKLEARVGIEPTHKGFADLSLTTWVPRPMLLS